MNYEQFKKRNIKSILSRDELVDYLVLFCKNSIESMRKENDNSLSECDTFYLRGQIKFAKEFLKILREDNEQS